MTSPESNLGIICACPEEFDHVWTVRHQVVTRLSRRFWTVWMEPATGWRDVGISDGGPRIVAEPQHGKLLRYSPGILPLMYRPEWVARRLDALRLRKARNALIQRGCDRICLYLWRPSFAHYAELVKVDRCIYHIDDEYSFSTSETAISEEERTLIVRSDHVIIHSPALMEKKGSINPATTWIPNGVDYASFSRRRQEPDLLAPIPRPRAALVGVLKRQLDLRMLRDIALARPNLSVVLIGPRGTLGSDEAIMDELVAMTNVYELGQQDPGDLGAYMQHMDVLLMCYRMDNYTKYIYPLKLHEYLATGRPVVATPIRTAVEFGDVVVLAETRDEWLAAIDELTGTAARDPHAAKKRQDVARRFDWDVLVGKIVDVVTG